LLKERPPDVVEGLQIPRHTGGRSWLRVTD
jgi:hypothetical protein